MIFQLIIIRYSLFPMYQPWMCLYEIDSQQNAWIPIMRDT